MATQVVLTPNKTYATADNARTAIAKYPQIDNNPDLRYVIMVDPNGRYYCAFLGECAIQAGVHHAGFVVIG